MPRASDMLANIMVDVLLLGLSSMLMVQLISWMDPRSKERSKAQRRGKAQLLAGRLLRGTRKGKQIALSEHEIEVAADVVRPEDVGVSFSDIGGLTAQARHLREALLLPLRRPDIFANSKLLRPPKGILLYGPPGTGKTMLARAIASEANFTFIVLNPARLFSKWYGESNKFAEAYFQLAHKLAPSIIFVDEIDCLFASSKKSGNEHEATSVLRAQFLTLWDGLLSPNAATASATVVVIAATNRPESVDPAVLRRLPLTFQVEMPGIEARLAVLECLLRGEPLAEELDKRQLAVETEGYSGSDLEQLCRTAALRPMQELLHESDCGAHDAYEDEDSAADSTYTSCQPEPALRNLTIFDFREAMALVPPSGSRLLLQRPPSVLACPEAAAYEPPDADLYD